MQGRIVAIMLAVTLFSPMIVAVQGEDEISTHGSLIDVVVIDLSCEENQTCVNRPNNFIEYFGADWCTNCPEVEEILEDIDLNNSLIMSHRPSIHDDFWLNQSRYRFLDVYGLWGYPSVILDGHYLFAGPTQTRDLQNKISEYDANYSGISTIELNNNTLSLNGLQDGLIIDVWTVKTNENLINFASNHTLLNESGDVDLDGDKLVVTISQPGYIQLTQGSDNPANDYNPDFGFLENGEQRSQIKTSTVVIITILLLMISLPSLVQLVRIMNSNDDFSDSEE